MIDEAPPPKRMKHNNHDITQPLEEIHKDIQQALAYSSELKQHLGVSSYSQRKSILNYNLSHTFIMFFLFFSFVFFYFVFSFVILFLQLAFIMKT